MHPSVTIDREALAAFCRRHGIRRLAVFGSALRDDVGPHSDVDVLVEFEPGRTPGLVRILRDARRSEPDVWSRLDLHTPASLSRYFRDKVLAGAQDQYVAA